MELEYQVKKQFVNHWSTKLNSLHFSVFSIPVNGVIMPIHKKGSENLVDNYRGVTLLSTLGKLFTKLLNNRLSFWADTYLYTVF